MPKLPRKLWCLREKYFINHPNPVISSLAIDLLTSPYELHNWESRSIFVKTELDVLRQSITGSVFRYKDLIIEGLMLGTANATDGLIRFNGDTGSNYSATFFYGLGTGTGSSGRTTSQTSMSGIFPRTTAGTLQLQLMSYANTNVNKTVLQRIGVADYAVWAGVGRWNSTAAITSVSLTPSGADWAAGTVLRLWGIAG